MISRSYALVVESSGEEEGGEEERFAGGSSFLNKWMVLMVSGPGSQCNGEHSCWCFGTEAFCVRTSKSL